MQVFGSVVRNGMVQDAVRQSLEIMGESIKKLPEAWKQTRPRVEWVRVSNFCSPHLRETVLKEAIRAV